ncbi:hypothetical protein KXD93_04935 [Mucilaginibacter sp. BJC16-A38]|uniref:hypothetical protein n=1 Tax=Mucilaginibacter phenanthrenivorans TaxID=1234842 RepID=UPI0021580FE5|nr:hypothetical protein [Mucilaginibacter phenanthrenivorans]MCR8556972.1 hypothetical protein [Mucilaginibacter phenanthrenivorans]
MAAFSDESLYRNSMMFEGEVIEHLTSWLSVNPYKGCSLKCAYCFRANWYQSDKPFQLYSEEECLEALLKHKAFVPNITPISINNSSTDALLPQVRKSTFRFINMLDELGYSNPFILISKLALTKNDLSALENLHALRPIFFTSFSLLPKHIEPMPVSIRIKNLARLKSANIPAVLYFRPIVKDWNDSDEIIKKALQVGQDYCNAICIGGLRMSPEIRAELQKVGEKLDEFPDEFDQKKIDNAIENRILALHQKLGLDVPVFKHSSCAVSFITKQQNYNLLFKNPENNCLVTCPPSQQALCNKGIV